MAITIRPKQASVVEGDDIQLIIEGLGDERWKVDVFHDKETNVIHTYTSPAVPNDKIHTETINTAELTPGLYAVELAYWRKGDGSQPEGIVHTKFYVCAKADSRRHIMLDRPERSASEDQALWAAIRNRTGAISYDRYAEFIGILFGEKTQTHANADLMAIRRMAISSTDRMNNRAIDSLNVHGPYAYSLLKFATQVFLTLESGVLLRDDQWSGYQLFDPEKEQSRIGGTPVTLEELNQRLHEYLRGSNEVLPYLERIVSALMEMSRADKEVLPYCYGVLQHRFTQPSLIELIWSYWHEEGMLAQTMNAIAFRFQNQRSGPNDPLGELEIDPLRPLNNMIWGFVQDEHNRLSVRRRAFEYDHHYGLKLLGRAVPELQSADSRSKFIETFHNLLYRTAVFYREDADTTVVSDAFPLLNALKDVHLLLAEGAHNQYGDLPWTARAEMLTQQWMLARPEMREFLRGRHMVPYEEKWMGAVDAMKRLQGWSDTSISHFNELAVDGERLLLSIRFGNWSDLQLTEENAKNWARYWKPEIQRYLYGYLAVTGVDLMAEVTDNREAATRNLQPSMLLQRRLAAQARQPALSAPGAAMRYRLDASGYAELPRGGGMRALTYEKEE